MAEQAARTGRGELPTAALLEAPVPFVLSGGWPLGLVSERAERTAQTPPEPWDQHRVARRRRTGQKSGPCSGRTACQRKRNEGGQKKGLYCKLLKRKKIKSSLAIPCAVYSVALSLGSFPVESWSLVSLHRYKNA